VKPVCLHSKAEIAVVLQRNALHHLYALGDLDDFFWPYTTWYALKQDDQIQQIAFVYTGLALPVLHGISEEPLDALRTLLQGLVPILPRRVYAHLSGNAVEMLAPAYQIEPHGTYYKMVLADPKRLAIVNTADVVALSGADLGDLVVLYQASYPENWFDPRMLETGHYYGIRRAGQLVSVAGVHVYSSQYRVAALGNITTHPAWRGQGLAAATTARLCQALLTQVEHIGLNVRIDNGSALACYTGLGFRPLAVYGEYMLVAHSLAAEV
jgi:GNAT superfamily N-acetyltransferase